MQEFQVTVPFDLEGYISKETVTESGGQLRVKSKAESVELQVFNLAVSKVPFAAVTLPPVEAKRLAEILLLAFPAHGTESGEVFAKTRTLTLCDEEKEPFGGTLNVLLDSEGAGFDFLISETRDSSILGSSFFTGLILSEYLPLMASAMKIAAEIAEETSPC